MFCIITITALVTAGTIRTAISVLPPSSATSKSNQTANAGGNTTIIQYTKNQKNYNATENMIVAFTAADSLLMQALR
jgi:hypothetical protein